MAHGQFKCGLLFAVVCLAGVSSRTVAERGIGRSLALGHTKS